MKRSGYILAGYEPRAGRPLGPDGKLQLQPLWLPKTSAEAQEPEPVAHSRGIAQGKLLI
jgi:hypothetical protein